MGGIALVLTAALLSLLALKQYRHRGGVSPMLLGCLAAALVAGSGGLHLVSQARAVPSPTVEPVSGPAEFQLANQEVRVFSNESGGPLSIGITLAPVCSIAENNSGEAACAEGSVFENQSLCAIEIECEVNEGNASDRRLKTDVTQTGVAANGLPLYRFRYIDGTQYYEGVMAQDVLSYKPEAVSRGSDGFYRVHYDQLGLEMRAVE
jgi:hypothetical protein